MYLALALAILTHVAPASASGWHDYRLEIAPGFAVERMNSFQICLQGDPTTSFWCARSMSIRRSGRLSNTP